MIFRECADRSLIHREIARVVTPNYAMFGDSSQMTAATNLATGVEASFLRRTRTRVVFRAGEL
jgi:hypothetical protein